MSPLPLPAPNKKAAPPDGMSETDFLLKLVEISSLTSSLQELFYAPHINLGKVRGWAPRFDQIRRIF